MAMNFLSPGVNFEEVDNTLTTQSVGMWAGATVIQAEWGPVDYPVFVDSQTTLVDVFGKPNLNNFKSWYSASNYLDYTSSMYIVRSAASTLANATCKKPQSITTNFVIKNEVDYSMNYMDGQAQNYGEFACKYPCKKGNSLLVTYADSATFNSWVLKEVDDAGNPIVGDTVVAVKIINGGSGYKEDDKVKVTSDSGSNASFKLVVDASGVITQVVVKNGGYGYKTTDVITVESTVGSSAELQLDLQIEFDCRKLFSGAPSTSAYAAERGGSNDEIHMLVLDAGGLFTGSRYSVLEKYENLSKGRDCKSLDGVSNFYKRVLLDTSKYVYWLRYPEIENCNWENGASNTTFTSLVTPFGTRFSNGADGFESTDAEIMLAFDEFKNKEAYDITNIVCGAYSKKVAKYVVETICHDRLDCVAFISPNNASGTEVIGGPIQGTMGEISEATIAWRQDAAFNVNTSYAVMDSGWKYQYDKFNDEYRWVPLCADVAGLRARTSENQYPWFSEAGYNRGQIKNVVKLSFNPRKEYRDNLYQQGINPVVTFAGEGTILYGDKTLLSKPSAFQHTNVRFLFIYLEKTLTDAAKYLLFEINDEITRAYAKSLCEPVLNEVLGNRGIYAYKVVCDTSNNTDLVIDQNKFALDIYVQPARSINYINMKFIAEKTGSTFSEAG